jgi:hypothetical protein
MQKRSKSQHFWCPLDGPFRKLSPNFIQATACPKCHLLAERSRGQKLRDEAIKKRWKTVKFAK